MGDWWDDGDAGVEGGLTLYEHYTKPSVEERFEETSRIVQARRPQHLDHGDLETVIRFKIGDNRWLGPTIAAVKEVHDVESITEGALEHGRLGERRAALVALMPPNLPRVGVPIASAILALAMPDRYGIIDRFAMGEVANLVTAGVRDGRAPDSALSLLSHALVPWVEDDDKLTAFEHFTAGLCQRSADLGTRPPRDIEKALFGHTLDRRSRNRRR